MAYYKKFKTETFTTKAYCDCGEGELKWLKTQVVHDISNMKDVTEYIHQCTRCGRREVLDDAYPKKEILSWMCPLDKEE